MFNKNPYLLPQGFPSNDINSLSHHASTYLAGLTADNILFHDHDDEPSGNYLAAAAAAGDAPVIDAAAFFNHQGFCGMNGDPSAMVNSYPRGAKRDRHSKICTAQGPRDRRVRLSIGVARRFFDLQEILGFDKPSKTLDWLLTKSKTAIKDLVQSTREKSATSSSPDQDANFENGRFFGSDSKRKLVEMNKHKASDLAKESRAKARARARERTREKMCIKKLNESQKFYGYDDLINPSSIPIQYMNNQLEFCKISGSSCCSSYPYTRAIEGNRNAILHCQPTYEAPNHEDLIQEESIVIKRKVKHPSKLGFQQNLIFSPFNQTDNWDISTSFASQSNICAILDQHKFINSTSNN